MSEETRQAGIKCPFISVIVCTRNRGNDLGNMLDSLMAMDVPADLAWELVLVDNGSSDNTATVIETYESSLPIVVAFESRAGLSFARNCGVAKARGEYICWTDDDVRVASDWLSAYAKAFRDHPEAIYFGGAIEPVFEGRPPAWLSDNLDLLGSAFARRELGGEKRPFAEQKGDAPFGANFAVRTAEQKRFLYPVNLGVSPDFQRLGEEALVIRKLRAEGATGYWVPQAKVRHIIPEKRQSLDYICSYRRAAGETWAVLEDGGDDNFMGVSFGDHSRRMQGAPIWIWRKTISYWLRFHLTKPFRPSKNWLPLLWNYGYYRGALDYLRKVSA